MAGPIKTEGFKIPGVLSPSTRHPYHSRPFSDGSMTVDTNILSTSLTSPTSHSAATLPIASPFTFASSLPTTATTPFDYTLSPNQHGTLSSPSSNTAGFHPAALFGGFKFGPSSHDAAANPEPPIAFSTHSTSAERSRSSSRGGGGVNNSKTKGRKLSMDAKFSQQQQQATQRGRTMQLHPRAMSHSTGELYHPTMGRGLGIALDTHEEGKRTDSISPPEYGVMSGSFGMPIPRSNGGGLDGGASWGSGAPSLVPGSFGSYNDEVIVESPMTPAHPLPNMLPGESNDTYKKQRRRECHNQVEKRRREHINAKIEELSHLLPPTYMQIPEENAIGDDDFDEEHQPQQEQAGAEGSPVKKKKTKRSGSSSVAAKGKDAVQCKGRILSQSVLYINDLKHITEMQAVRIQQLESILSGNPGLSAGTSNGLYWPGASSDPFAMAHHPAHQHPQQAYHGHQLEVMRPSPEPDNEYARRSSSFSTDSPERRGTGSSFAGGEDERTGSMRWGARTDSFGGGGKGSHVRRESDVELQAGVAGMDLDAMFGGGGGGPGVPKREEAIRW